MDFGLGSKQQTYRLVRELGAKHAEWGTPFTIVKLGISKAYDTLEWQAIEDEFFARGMLTRMRGTYWDLHAGRRQHFHTGDSTIAFDLVPNRGIPQGPPESPGVHAAVLEGLLQRAGGRLVSNNRLAGLPPSSEHSWCDVEEYKTGNKPFE